MLAVEKNLIEQLLEVTEQAGRSLDFTSPASKNNPIANFALAWSEYRKMHLALVGTEPEPTYYYNLHHSWYVRARYTKRREKKPKKTKMKGKGSILAQINAGQGDMFAPENDTKGVIEYDEMVVADFEAFKDPTGLATTADSEDLDNLLAGE